MEDSSFEFRFQHKLLKKYMEEKKHKQQIFTNIYKYSLNPFGRLISQLHNKRSKVNTGVTLNPPSSKVDAMFLAVKR